MKNKVTILTITSVLTIANVMCIPVSDTGPVGSALNAVRELREGRGSRAIGPKEIQSDTSPTSNPATKPQATASGMVASCHNSNPFPDHNQTSGNYPNN